MDWREQLHQAIDQLDANQKRQIAFSWPSFQNWALGIGSLVITMAFIIFIDAIKEFWKNLSKEFRF